jgi:flagellin
MTVINTNVGALTARTYALQAQDAMQKSMERLSSGLRINSAADDAAGLAVANKMESQLRGMNVAIRNSQDGISLVQTAESGMGEITNMIIRMRELSVQMNNGVYTDTDRSNAQLEINALLAEVDKIADNTAFNDVKVLDGSYSNDIRAGNTNAEIITVTIDRMKTDTLGGNSVTTAKAAATKVASNPNTALTSKTVVTAQEGDKITIAAAVLNPEFDNSTAGKFANTYTGGTFTLTGDDAADFTINSSTGAITSASVMDFENAQDANTDNTYKFNVVYTQGTNVFTDAVELKVTDSTPAGATVAEANATVLTTAETTALTLNTTGTSGTLSAKFQEFAEADKTGATYGGTFSLTAHSTDAGDVAKFDISATGVVSLKAGVASLNFEGPSDVGTDNSYKFNVVYTDANSNVFTEAVQLNVTDATTDTGTAFIGTVAPASNVGKTGQSFVDITVDTSDANGGGAVGQTFDIENDTTLLSGAAKSLIDGATALSYSVTLSGGSGVTESDTKDIVFGATATGPVTAVVAITDTVAGVATTVTETITFAVSDALVAAPSATADSASTKKLATGSLTTFSLGTSGGEAIGVDLDTVNATALADLSAFRTAFGTDGAYALTAGSADFTLDSDNVLSLKEGKGAATYTATVTYTKGSDVFTQELSITTTDATEAGAATGSQTSTTDTAAATRTSSEVVSGKTSLLVDEARQGTIKSVGTGKVLSDAFDTFVTAHPKGKFTLEGTDATLFNVDAKTGDITSKGLVDYETKTSYEFSVKYTEGTNIYTEAVAMTVTDDVADAGTHLADVDLSTSSGAAASVLILDKALEQISSSQAKLGAIQNRLQHNIDNLSMASMLTETARGRVVDADFARETSELSKQQILGQAATSMLAQANQSKQSVLALLQ